ncbi:hypothetical protein B0T18DRAFT_387052 [Schizothecium vesticola]|uniref:Uncharacterized protein n=1 Tax=Schizothecium vesticola TaxID=314040 RepID=A0AA40F431_9PEZI|nr:hypothetical protein B0T18DRAFT_387052 [Schizothecium vesticola]
MAPNTDISTRALIITLKSPVVGLTSADIFATTGISISTINRIYGRAIGREFDLNIRPLVIKDEWLEDASRSGRPRKQTPEATEKVVTKPPASSQGGFGYLSYHNLEDSQKRRVQQDKTNEETWVDEEDEGGTT